MFGASVVAARRQVEPFGDSSSRCIYSDKQKASFEAYRKQQEPRERHDRNLGVPLGATLTL